jgi:DNA-binding FrmR family transcriptional regulator
MYGYIEHKDLVAKRLRRIEGQVRGLQQMIEDDRYCIDILTQISAATKALQAVAVELMGDHLSSCVSEAVKAGGPEAKEKITEATDAIARLVRS